MRARSGIALLITLLGVLTLEIVVAGVFHLSIQQLRLARAQTQAVQLQAAAQAAIGSTLARWSSIGADTMADGDSTAVASTADPGTQVQVVVHALGEQRYLVRAEATSAAGGARAAAAFVRSRVPAELLRGLPAVVSAGSAAGVGRISGAAPGTCATGDTLPQRIGDLAVADTAGSAGLASEPVTLLARAPVFPQFAGIELGQLAPPVPPDQAPARLHADSISALHVVGNLTVQASAAGILVVDGDLVLGPGSRFAGILVVRGTLRLLPGARLDGAAQAARVELLDAQVYFDPCALLAVVRAHPALNPPVRASLHWWIPSA